MGLRDRFTDRFRRALQQSANEAARLGNAHIDTEHLLLALIAESGGVAAIALKNVGLHPAKIALEINKHSTPPITSLPSAKACRTAAADLVIEYAIDEAEQLKHDYVGTEHLLL